VLRSGSSPVERDRRLPASERGSNRPLKVGLRTNWLMEEQRIAMTLRTIKSYDALSASTVSSCFKEAIPRPETQ
jgi:hypothetical protein